jgi:hypothetical protein
MGYHYILDAKNCFSLKRGLFAETGAPGQRGGSGRNGEDFGAKHA